MQYLRDHISPNYRRKCVICALRDSFKGNKGDRDEIEFTRGILRIIPKS